MPKSPTRPTQYPSPQWARALHRGKPRHSCRGGRPHVVHRRFHKTRTDPLAVAVALAVVRDEAAIALDIRGKLLYRLAQLPCCGVVALVGGGVEVAFHEPQFL